VSIGQNESNSSTRQVTFLESAGNYPFTVSVLAGYRPLPGSGTVWVNDSAPAPIRIMFYSTATFPITFAESGLPVGTGWAIAIGDQFQSSFTRTLTIYEMNGTFEYLVLAVPGYSAPTSGTVTVNGTDLTVPVNFSAQAFPVTVDEFGLPNGTRWSATVANGSLRINETRTSTTFWLLFALPNGTYSLTVSVPSGYTATVSSATFTVAGFAMSGPTVDVRTTSPGQRSPVGNNSTVGSDLGWWVAGGLAVALGIVVVLALVGRRGSGRPRGPPPGTTE
jgi:hypothetical protein